MEHHVDRRCCDKTSHNSVVLVDLELRVEMTVFDKDNC